MSLRKIKMLQLFTIKKIYQQSIEIVGKLNLKNFSTEIKMSAAFLFQICFKEIFNFVERNKIIFSAVVKVAVIRARNYQKFFVACDSI